LLIDHQAPLSGGVVALRAPPSIAKPNHLSGENMLKTTRWATLAALLMVAAAAAVTPLASQAQGQPAPAATPAPAAAPSTAPAATSAPAAKSNGAKGNEIVENPYGLDALWRGSDWVAKATLVILAIMSIGSWYIIVTKVYEQYKLGREARIAEKSFWSAPSVKQGADGLKEGSPFRFIAESGLEAQSKHTGLLGNINLSDWVSASIQRAIDNVASRLGDGLAFLATVGSTAPFVGLFGTVWGIYHALTAIGIAGQASIDRVAGPVGEALIMTAIGLAVAVPAVLGYNWLIRRNKRAMEDVRAFGADLHAVLMSAKSQTAKA
jgi:biopolymer transport protein ExbB